MCCMYLWFPCRNEKQSSRRKHLDEIRRTIKPIKGPLTRYILDTTTLINGPPATCEAAECANSIRDTHDIAMAPITIALLPMETVAALSLCSTLLYVCRLWSGKKSRVELKWKKEEKGQAWFVTCEICTVCRVEKKSDTVNKTLTDRLGTGRGTGLHFCVDW